MSNSEDDPLYAIIHPLFSKAARYYSAADPPFSEAVPPFAPNSLRSFPFGGTKSIIHPPFQRS